VALIPVALFVILWLFLTAGDVPSNIVDFHPTNFQAKTDANFFYSIGNELKYSDQIDSQAPTLLKGQIKNFLVSPDNKMIAVVADGQLQIVDTEQPTIRRVTPVDSIYREPKPIGQRFFRDDDFQWTKDSKSLYLIADEFYASKGSQLYSIKGELWKYDLQTGSLQVVLKPFPAYNYFFGLKSGIYFSVPTDVGNLQLRYYDGQQVSDIGKPNGDDIPPEQLAKNFVESPFYSFSINDYANKVLTSKGVRLLDESRSERQTLMIGSKPYLALTEGNGFKGHYYCSEMLRNVFLPGDRFFLFTLSYCGNYKGQLLIDTVSGKYQRLPADTVVYIILNTETYPRYDINGGGIIAK